MQRFYVRKLDGTKRETPQQPKTKHTCARQLRLSYLFCTLSIYGTRQHCIHNSQFTIYHYF